MTEFFYNDTQPAFAETRIIAERLQLTFVGSPPFIVKPGMPFEGQVSIMLQDQVSQSKIILNAQFSNLNSYIIPANSKL